LGSGCNGHTDGVNLNRAWEYLERERYIQGDGPNTTQSTIFKISDLGTVATGKERRQRQGASDAERKGSLQLDEHPNIINRIPAYHIASFLGITNPSLSRIRKRIQR